MACHALRFERGSLTIDDDESSLILWTTHTRPRLVFPMPAVLLAPGERHAGVVSEALLRSWLPFCKALPKAELHAHINGSVRDETLRRAGGAPHRVPLLVLTLTCGPFSELAAARADDEAVQRDAYRLLHRGATWRRSICVCRTPFAHLPSAFLAVSR